MEHPGDINVVCFGGEDWWYHNRAHIDMQLMRQFAKNNTSLYINSIVMQKPNLKEGGRLGKRLLRKLIKELGKPGVWKFKNVAISIFLALFTAVLTWLAFSSLLKIFLPAWLATIFYLCCLYLTLTDVPGGR